MYRHILCFAAVALAACSADPDRGLITSPKDIGADAGMSTDAAVDAGPTVDAKDTAPDSSDISADAPEDIPEEIGVDILEDIGVDVLEDIEPDAPVDAPDAIEDDVPPPPNLLDELDGVWLIGWGGGLDHFDWFRFGPLDASGGGGTVIWAAPEDEGTLTSWIGCKGTTSWTMANKIDTIVIALPQGCGDTNDSITLSFEFPLQPGTWPTSAILRASVQELLDGSANAGYKYPSDWCTPDLSSCTYPF